jgi:uncharacterized protein
MLTVAARGWRAWRPSRLAAARKGGRVAAIPKSPLTGSSTVTLITQTRVRNEHAGEFAQWQQHVNDVVFSFPGFVAQEVIPPAPPVQPDWVIVQRFTSLEDARAWLGSEERERLLDQAQPWLVGLDDVHVFEDGEAPETPRPVSALISTRVESGKEDAFRAWQRRIAAEQARFPGFQGYKLEPPRPGIQEDWVTILRFDSESRLDAWLSSPERRRLIAEDAAFTMATRIRTARTGFDQWFRIGNNAATTPSIWKQNLIVLLALYPVVFVFGRWVEIPHLVKREGMMRWESLFISNVVSVILLAKIVPAVSSLFSWWLHPARADRRRIEYTGLALVLLLFAVMLFVFSLI